MSQIVDLRPWHSQPTRALLVPESQRSHAGSDSSCLRWMALGSCCQGASWSSWGAGALPGEGHCGGPWLSTFWMQQPRTVGPLTGASPPSTSPACRSPAEQPLAAQAGFRFEARVSGSPSPRYWPARPRPQPQAESSLESWAACCCSADWRMDVAPMCSWDGGPA